MSVERYYERRPVIAREDFSLTDLTDLTQDHLVVGRKSGRPGESAGKQASSLSQQSELGFRLYQAAQHVMRW